MSFYNEFAKYYEYIFPADSSTITFLINHLKNNGKILDAACGSGEYSIGLTQNNYDVIGVDLEEEMIKAAKDKAKKMHLNVDFTRENILSLKNSFNENTFSGIFCIGNSLVHLNNHNEIYIALKNMYDLLKDKGSLIIEIMNYDKIISSAATDFSSIKDEKHSLELTGKFSIVNDNKLLFKGTLYTPHDNLDYAVSIFPLTSSELTNSLKKIGFRNIYLYSNFNGSVFNNSLSSSLVLTCKK